VSVVLQQRSEISDTNSRLADPKSRIAGVDVARGLALIGMMATHVFSASDDNGDPTLSTVVAAGRSATAFVVVAGVGLAFLSGGRTPLQGRHRTAVSAAFVIRALMVGGIGLGLGYLGPANGIDGILPLYGLLFLAAIPLIGSSRSMLIGIAAVLTVVGPVLIVATADLGLPYSGYAVDPTFGTVIRDPGGLLFQIGLTGAYPAVVYLAYLCVGLAIGRLDLRSSRVAWWLLGAGLALATAARATSAVVLQHLGGLDRLVGQYDLSDDPSGVTRLLWEPELSSSWWYLGLAAPHSHTPLDMLHTLGSAVSVLGATLLLTRVPVIARALSPLAAAGSMSLTLYSAHLILLAFGVGEDEPLLLFLSIVTAALALAWLWRSRVGPGPLEIVVSESAASVRRAVARRLEPSASVGPALTGLRDAGLSTTERLVIRVLALVTCAGVLALSLWGGAGSETAGPLTTAGTADGTSTEGFATVAPDGADVTTPQGAPVGVPPSSPAVGSPGPLQPVADVRRYCELSDELDDSDAVDASPLTELVDVAPPEIREAVVVVADGLRADADLPGSAAPDESLLDQAEVTVDDFNGRNCGDRSG
jgi:uncharacterized membrane protein YeiB